VSRCRTTCTFLGVCHPCATLPADSIPAGLLEPSYRVQWLRWDESPTSGPHPDLGRKSLKRRYAGSIQVWVRGLVGIQLRLGFEPDSTGATTVIPARSAAHSLLGVRRPQPAAALGALGSSETPVPP
jgi:hypothetical protein